MNRPATRPFRRGRRRDQRGAASLELVVLIPALVLMLGLLVAGGRLWFARSAVQDAAESAARAASLARTASEATTRAQLVVDDGLADTDLHCQSTRVTVSTDAFAVPVGQPATVTSEVTCVVSLGDILLPGLPGSITVTEIGRSALDTYRGRS